MSTHHKLGITTRHLAHRKREYQQACGIVNYYQVAKLDCSISELTALERNCLIATSEYRCPHLDEFGEPVDSRNETRWGVSAERLWGICLEQIMKSGLPFQVVNVAEELRLPILSMSGKADANQEANQGENKAEPKLEDQPNQAEPQEDAGESAFLTLEQAVPEQALPADPGAMTMRDVIQEEYISEIVRVLGHVNQHDQPSQPNQQRRCLMKAPTGFGKTHIYFTVIAILRPKKVILFTPRINLNRQAISERYTKLLGYHLDGQAGQPHQVDPPYIILEMTGSAERRQAELARFAEAERAILVCCYQGAGSFADAQKAGNGCRADLAIFDEAHYAATWSPADLSSVTTDGGAILFGTATPVDSMVANSGAVGTSPFGVGSFGTLVEKVKVYDLMRYGILCDINTIIKAVDDRAYGDLSRMILDNMTKYGKRRGLIYANTQANALSVFKELAKLSGLAGVANADNVNNADNSFRSQPFDIYLLTSDYKYHNAVGKVEPDILGLFSRVVSRDVLPGEMANSDRPALIVSVEMLSYGYDNPLIDFICFADPRQSAVGIRQAVGRGLRKLNTPDGTRKILHVLLPVYRAEFGRAYPALKEYLDYIIGECGQELIHGKKGFVIAEVAQAANVLPVVAPANYSHASRGASSPHNYNGEPVETEILREYCTDRYAKFSDFMRFLRENGVYDEETYRMLQTNLEGEGAEHAKAIKKAWLPHVETLEKRYKGRFGFKLLARAKYYETIEEAKAAIIVATKQLKNIGKTTASKKRRLLHAIDNKIPYDDVELFYPRTIKSQ